MSIPEIDEPKNLTMGFKVNKKDKELIEKYAKDKNYRLSAFLRVAVLSYIEKDK